MLHTLRSRTRLSLGARFTACFGFLAVLLALWAPVQMLAQDVQSGALGGVCGISASGGHADPDSGDAPPTSWHCELCCMAWLTPTAPPTLILPSAPGQPVALAVFAAPRSNAIPGLPFSRGPPAFPLN